VTFRPLSPSASRRRCSATACSRLDRSGRVRLLDAAVEERRPVKLLVELAGIEILDHDAGQHGFGVDDDGVRWRIVGVVGFDAWHGEARRDLDRFLHRMRDPGVTVGLPQGRGGGWIPSPNHDRDIDFVAFCHQFAHDLPALVGVVDVAQLLDFGRLAGPVFVVVRGIGGRDGGAGGGLIGGCGSHRPTSLRLRRRGGGNHPGHSGGVRLPDRFPHHFRSALGGWGVGGYDLRRFFGFRSERRIERGVCWVAGDLAHDEFLRFLAQRSGIRVLANHASQFKGVGGMPGHSMLRKCAVRL
jgi:hypothetical protein